MAEKKKQWWSFTAEAAEATDGTFRAFDFHRIGRLYYPLCNEAGMLSSVTPNLQGEPTAGQNMFLGLPLSAEDLPHNLVHRDFWVVEDKREPFGLSGLNVQRLADHLWDRSDPSATIEAGPGWFVLQRSNAARGYKVRAELWCAADVKDKLECMRVEVTNTSGKPLTFDPYAAIPLYARSADDLRDHRHVTALLHRAIGHPHGVTVQPAMSFDERGHRVNKCTYTVLAFGPGGEAPSGVWVTQESFLGEGGNYAAPRAVWKRQNPPNLTELQKQGREALGGFRFRVVTLEPGQSAQYLLVSGIDEKVDRAGKWSKLFASPERVERSLEATKAFWLKQIRHLEFRTADTDLNNWLTWVGLQPVLRRIYGNSFLPEFDYGRGGKGWRDLWQDCLALLLYEPERVRGMLLHNFGGVRIDGSNATIIGSDGSFIADRNNIPRTWMDHGCWPFHTTLLYVDQTGDLDFVLEERAYFRDPQIHRCRKVDTSWTEKYGSELRTRAGEIYKGTLLEHMLVQNVTAFFNVGDHNVCRLEGADWNDGLDMAAEKGESVAFSSFYAWNLARLAALLEAFEERGVAQVLLARELLMLFDRLPGQKRVQYGSAAAKRKRFEAYLSEVERDVSGRRAKVRISDLVADLRAKSRDLLLRVREEEWIRLGRSGACFNGYYDNRGRRVEGSHTKGVRMTLTGQVFPLMSGAATEEQVDRVIESVSLHLVDPSFGGVRLNTNFGELQPDFGRAFSFNYGEKENGAVFSHMAVMYAYALYLRRRSREGRAAWAALYRMAMNVETSRIFPGVPEYFNADGRGMYCYLTGSASWLVYLLLTQVFGVRGDLGDLVLDPQLVDEDFGKAGEVSVSTHFAGKRLDILFKKPVNVCAGACRVAAVSAQGQTLETESLPGGGVRIARTAIAGLPAGRAIRIVVELACG